MRRLRTYTDTIIIEQLCFLQNGMGRTLGRYITHIYYINFIIYSILHVYFKQIFMNSFVFSNKK